MGRHWQHLVSGIEPDWLDLEGQGSDNGDRCNEGKRIDRVKGRFAHHCKTGKVMKGCLGQARSSNCGFARFRANNHGREGEKDEG